MVSPYLETDLKENEDNSSDEEKEEEEEETKKEKLLPLNYDLQSSDKAIDPEEAIPPNPISVNFLETLGQPRVQRYMKSRLPKLWGRLKKHGRLLCKLYSNHKTEVEHLVAMYLQIGTKPTHSALQKFCGIKTKIARPTSAPQVEQILAKISDRLTKRFGESDYELRPETLNFILYPPTLSPPKETEVKANSRFVRHNGLSRENQIPKELWDMFEEDPEFLPREVSGRHTNIADTAKKYLEKNSGGNINIKEAISCGLDIGFPLEITTTPLPKCNANNDNYNHHHHSSSTTDNNNNNNNNEKNVDLHIVKKPLDHHHDISLPKEYHHNTPDLVADEGNFNAVWIVGPIAAVLLIFLLCVIIWLVRSRKKACESGGDCKCTYKRLDIPESVRGASMNDNDSYGRITETSSRMKRPSVASNYSKSRPGEVSNYSKSRQGEVSYFSKSRPSEASKYSKSRASEASKFSRVRPSAGDVESWRSPSERRPWVQQNGGFQYVDVTLDTDPEEESSRRSYSRKYSNR